MFSCFGCVQLFVTIWTVALCDPLSMGFSRQEYWSGFPYPPPGGSSQPRDQAHVSFVSWSGRHILYHQCHLGSSRSPFSVIFLFCFFQRASYSKEVRFCWLQHKNAGGREGKGIQTPLILSDSSQPASVFRISWEKAYAITILKDHWNPFPAKVWKKIWVQALFEDTQVALSPQHLGLGGFCLSKVLTLQIRAAEPGI